MHGMAAPQASEVKIPELSREINDTASARESATALEGRINGIVMRLRGPVPEGVEKGKDAAAANSSIMSRLSYNNEMLRQSLDHSHNLLNELENIV